MLHKLGAVGSIAVADHQLIHSTCQAAYINWGVAECAQLFCQTKHTLHIIDLACITAGDFYWKIHIQLF